MECWWYVRDDERIGPVSTETLQALYQQALVDTSTKVWREGMDAWLPLSGVHELNAALHVVPPPSPISHDDEVRLSLPLAGRWRRFLARTFDLWWEGLLVISAGSTVLGQSSARFVDWMNRPGSSAMFALLSVPLVLALDALVYSATGNTPGKAALGLQVTSIRGERLPFGDYLRRNLRLWVSGLGLCIPFFAPFTLARQSGRLFKGMQASYDEETGIRVHARPIGWARRAGFGVAFCGLMTLVGTLHVSNLERDRQLAAVARQKFYVWNNPETEQDIMVDARWVFDSRINDYGTRLFVFTERTHRAQVIFGPEDAPEMAFPQYVDAFVQSMTSSMRFSDRGRFTEKDGLPVWEGRGTLLSQKGSVLSVRILQLDDTFWRLIVVQQPPIEYSSSMVETLAKSLWNSVMPRAPRPTT